jgi:hypothetical protein
MYRTPGRTAVVSLLLVTWIMRGSAAEPPVAMIPTDDLNRQSEFDRTVAALQKRADIAPNIPENWHALAKHYYEKVKNDANLPSDLAKTYVMRGLEFEKRALMLDPNYYDAVVLRGSLLRQSALYEKDPAIQKRLIAEADALKQRAADLATNGKIGR